MSPRHVHLADAVHTPVGTHNTPPATDRPDEAVPTLRIGAGQHLALALALALALER